MASAVKPEKVFNILLIAAPRAAGAVAFNVAVMICAAVVAVVPVKPTLAATIVPIAVVDIEPKAAE